MGKIEEAYNSIDWSKLTKRGDYVLAQIDPLLASNIVQRQKMFMGKGTVIRCVTVDDGVIIFCAQEPYSSKG